MLRAAMGGENSSPSSMMLRIKEIDTEKMRDMGFRISMVPIFTMLLQLKWIGRKTKN